MAFVLMVAAAALPGAAVAAPGRAPDAAQARVTATIVPYKSIGGLALGATPGEIERRLGRPGETIRVAHRIAELAYYNYGLSISFDTLQRSDPADDVAASGTRYHTPNWIHVGTPAARVKRAYRGAVCDRFACRLYKGAPGAVGTRITTFTFFEGKVDSIQVQISYE